MSKIKKVAITGASGQIAYSLIFRIASGELFGNAPLALHLIEVPAVVDSLKGLILELEDCSFPHLKEIKISSDPKEGFEGVDYALLIGSKPRGPGMERKDLLSENGQIFQEQGRALNEVASKDVLVFVVGNPCNTNCLIALKNAPRLNPRRFHAMTRLDQNRAAFQLSKKARVNVDEVKRVTIWGNHSATQVPDFLNATIQGKPAFEKIHDRKWLENEFIPLVQKRGGEVIKARGKSSAASAAQAILDGMRSIINPTPQGEWFSTGILSEGNPYGIKEGIVFSFPCISRGNGEIEIASHCTLDPFLKEKIAETEKELLEEKGLISHLLGNE